MNLYLNEIMEGFNEAIALHKQGNNIFEQSNHPMFPQHTNQQKWRYAKHDKGLHLHDGQQTYSFNAPEGLHEDQDSPLERADSPHNFEEGAMSKGFAQVHHSDPGQIYFTIQEGKSNPTFTFRHVGGSNWKAIPKAKKKKGVVEGVIPITPEHPSHAGAMPPTHDPMAAPQGMPQEAPPMVPPQEPVLPGIDPHQAKLAFIQEMLKKAAFGDSMPSIGNAAIDTFMTPGTSPLAYGALGAGLGGAYYGLKKN